jgi:hypothetical protein
MPSMPKRMGRLLKKSFFDALKNKVELEKNGERCSSQRFAHFMEALFLWLRLGTASRRLSIVCSLPLGQGRISSQRSDAQARLPSQRATQGKRLRTHRLRCTRPNRQQRRFRGCPASLAVLQVPRPCVRCALLQPFCFSENQGLLAKLFTFLNS